MKPLRGISVGPFPCPLRVDFGDIVASPEGIVSYQEGGHVLLPAGEQWDLLSYLGEHNHLRLHAVDSPVPSTGTMTTGQLVSKLYRQLLDELGAEEFVRSGAKAAVDALLDAIVPDEVS